VVERADLMSRLWPGIHVEDSSLNQCIVQLRRAVGETVVETVPRIGYRIPLPFDPELEERATQPAAEVPHRRARWLSGITIAVLVMVAVWAVKLYMDRESRQSEVRRLNSEAARLERWGRFSEASEAMALLQRAVIIDPSSAYTHALIAETMARSGQRLPGQERLEAERAVRIDPRCGECQAILGWILMSREWRWKEAGEHLSVALQLSPRNAYAHQWQAQLLAARGQFDGALAETARAIDLEPWNHAHVSTMAGILYLAGRYDESLVQCYRALALRPNYQGANNWLYRVLLRQGRFEDAIRVAVTADAAFAGFSPDAEEQHAIRALEAFRHDGITGASRHFLGELSGPQAQVRRYDRAMWKVLAGDTAGALQELQQAVEFRQFQMMFLKVDPLFAPLAQNPEFQQVLAKLGV
jgi:tetratricopeptide (TPR) repeat protein